MATGPRRHHAIEHVDAARDALDQVIRRADAHEIARLIRREIGLARFDRREHIRLRLAHREAAERVARQVEPRERLRAFPAQKRVGAPLNDAEQCPPFARLHQPLEGGLRALRPAQREPHRARDLLVWRRQPDAFVELHDDVAIEQVLDLDRALGREFVLRAVDMALECHALFGELAQRGEAHHLKPARIREDRVRPARHLVQPAKLGDPLRAGAQHQVIRIAEDDVGAGLAHLFHVKALHRAGGADRHEGWRADLAARHRDAAGTGRAVARLDGEGEVFFHCRSATFPSHKLGRPFGLWQNQRPFCKRVHTRRRTKAFTCPETRDSRRRRNRSGSRLQWRGHRHRAWSPRPQRRTPASAASISADGNW